MSYPRQDTTNERLHRESVRALDALGAKHFSKLSKAWSAARRTLLLSVVESVRMASTRGKWNLARYKSSGAQAKFSSEASATLQGFRAIGHNLMKNAFNDLYRQSLLRYAYALDMTTPDSRDVRLPHRDRLYEAAVRVVYGTASGSQGWAERWTAWVESYRDSLVHNVGMKAMNEAAVDDTMGVVDATRSGSPAFRLEDAMARLFESEGNASISAGAQTISDLNGDLIETEIWKTRGDARVCDECDANEGLTIEEADGDIPLHPNCNCYWLTVPKSYADLLASGSEEDQALAEQMLARGLVPNSLAITDEDGNLAGKVIVTFQKWVGGQEQGALSTGF